MAKIVKRILKKTFKEKYVKIFYLFLKLKIIEL